MLKSIPQFFNNYIDYLFYFYVFRSNLKLNYQVYIGIGYFPY